MAATEDAVSVVADHELDRDLDPSSEPAQPADESPHISRFQSLRKWLIYALLLVIILYALSLVVINTPWFKSKITHKLERKSGLEWQLGSVYWVPFGDLYLNDLDSRSSATAAAGGVSIKCISISPSWNKLFAGDLVWTEVMIDGLDLDVDREWLENQMKQSTDQEFPRLREDKKQVPVARAEPKVPAGASKKPTKPKNPQQSKPVAIQQQETKIPVGAERWLKFKNCNIRVRGNENTYLEYKNISMEVPVSGRKKNGLIKMLDDQGREQSMPILWNEQEIIFNNEELIWQGVKMHLQSRIRPSGTSLFFVFQLMIDDQALEYHLNRPNFKVRVTADRLKGNFVLKGNLLSPQTWNGIGGVGLANLKITEDQKTHETIRFDQVYARTRVYHGNLLIEDAQAQSESLSFMANGVVTKNSYSYGVLRCVADMDHVNKLDRFYKGSKAIHVDRGKHSVAQALNTPDRQYFDLFFDGKLKALEVKHNRADRWQSLKQVINSLRKFKNNELKEDGLYQVR